MYRESYKIVNSGVSIIISSIASIIITYYHPKGAFH